MTSFILNIDVPDVETGIAFYTAAFELSIGRRFDDDFVELLGAETKIYLLAKAAGTRIGPAEGDVRRYERHWSPNPSRLYRRRHRCRHREGGSRWSLTGRRDLCGALRQVGYVFRSVRPRLLPN